MCMSLSLRYTKVNQALIEIKRLGWGTGINAEVPHSFHHPPPVGYVGSPPGLAVVGPVGLAPGSGAGVGVGVAVALGAVVVVVLVVVGLVTAVVGAVVGLALVTVG